MDSYRRFELQMALDIFGARQTRIRLITIGDVFEISSFCFLRPLLDRFVLKNASTSIIVLTE